MKKIITILTVATLVIWTGMDKTNYLTSLFGHENSNHTVKVSVKDDIIYFKGNTEKKSYETLLKKVEQYPDRVFKKIIVNSGGGSTIYGRKIADFIFKNNLDIEIEEICFSSCANYIFPAGKIKYIQKNAFVGWHGSEHQTFILNENQNSEEHTKAMIREALISVGLQDEKQLKQQIEIEYHKSLQGLQEETSFFKKIDTDIVLTLLGFQERTKRPLTKESRYIGWTYKIEDMKKFGVKDVVYLGEKSKYPVLQDKYQGLIFVQDYDDKKAKEIKKKLASQKP